MNNKIAIFFASALAFATAATKPKSMIQAAVDTCAVENGLPADQYDHFVFYDLNMKLEDCVAACAMKKLGTMSKDGVFTGSEVKELIASATPAGPVNEELAAIVDRCVNYGQGGEDSCETVMNLRSCYEVVFREILDDDSMLIGSINQVLMFTIENFADAYPGGMKSGSEQSN